MRIYKLLLFTAKRIPSHKSNKSITRYYLTTSSFEFIFKRGLQCSLFHFYIIYLLEYSQSMEFVNLELYLMKQK